MKINRQRIAAYLSGNFPPYYQIQSKINFILTVSAVANISKERFKLIERHTNSTQSFFRETLNLINDDNKIIEICKKLSVPFEVDENLKYDIIIKHLKL